jgi:hypothetical protein
MKKQISSFLLIAFISAIAFTGCKKYEDGPTISLNSKKSRVVNVWVIDKIYSNETDITDVFVALWPNFSFDLKNDNTYILTWTSSTAEQGTWAFDSAKEYIITIPNYSSISTKWRILRLKSDEAWVETTADISGVVTKYEFKSK